uniref:RAB34, member RAS oncogene family n=1 Tax=Zosterops lateralis melanops TaxID=1220523 RepID=A0A8D2PAE4_ZOSLA
MNVLAPVRRDRVIADLRASPPPCRFKISKIIVVGDLSVGKTCLINRFCKDTFDKNYKATIGVDFEMERFEVLGVPFMHRLHLLPGTAHPTVPVPVSPLLPPPAIVIVFDVNDVGSLEHTRQWLADALKENDPSNVILFLVGSKKDLSVSVSPSLWASCALAVPVTHPSPRLPGHPWLGWAGAAVWLL